MRIGQSHYFWRKYSLLKWVFRIYSSFWRECAEICCFKHRGFRRWSLPSSILTFCLDELLPVTTEIVNLSLESGVFSGDWKNALVHPLLKKAGLQPFNKNLRPASNLQFTSKIKEKSVALQMQDLMVANGLFPDLQCMYWQNHSSETALVKVRNDLLPNMDKGHLTSLALVDLSAAFDTEDHSIPLHRLQSKLDVGGKALWLFENPVWLEERSRFC